MEYEEIKKSLEKDYLIIKKGKWWSFLGGAVTFVVIAGFVSYQAGLRALEGHAATKATAEIETLLAKAKTDRDEIGQNLADSKNRLSEMDEQLAAMSELWQSLTEIKEAIERGNPWEPFSDNLKDVIKETDKYEYAVMRNGAFRTLTASEWNDGWRVMTSPYMTGDKERFTLGGSMWIWGTQDSRDDAGVYHLYYYYVNGGVISVEDEGNKLTKADTGGEGMIYRRLRK